MSDRQVKIVIAADVASALRGLQQVQSGLGQVGQAGSQASSQAESFGQKLKEGLEVAGVTLGLAGVAAAIGKTISIGMSFEDNLNQLRAVSGATAAEMGLVSDRARALGNDLDLPTTSASDAAEAMLELSKGGLTVKESMDAAKGTLTLAAAAQISGAQAAEIQSNALNAFGLSADQAGRVADVLANTANAASGEITDFAAAMAQSAGVSNMFGVSIEDSSTVLGIFAKAGLQGSDAGTSLKTSLLAMLDPTKKQQEALQTLGLTVFDAQGNFVGMRTITEQLGEAQGNLTQETFNTAAATVFGSDAVRAASFLAQGGAAAYDEMALAVGRTGGAQELAGSMTEGLSGQLGKLQSAAEDVALSLYGNFVPALTEGASFATTMVGVLGDVVNWFAELPGPVQAAALSLGAVAALSGPLNALWVSLIARLAAAKAAMITFAATMRASVGSMAAAGAAAAGLGRGLLAAFGGPIGIAIAAGATALAIFAGSSGDAEAATSELTGAIDEQTGALTENAAQLLSDTASKSGASQAYKNLGGDVSDYIDAMGGVPGAAEKVNAVIDAGRVAYEKQQDAVQAATTGTGNFGTAAAVTTDQMGGLAPSIFDVNKAAEFLASTDTTLDEKQKQVALSGEGMKGALGGAGEAAAGAAPEVEALGDALKKATENAQLMASLTEGAGLLSAVSAAASDAARALDLFKIAQDAADGRTRSLDDALVAQQATLAALAGAWEDGTAAATENKEAGDLNTQALLDWNVTALAATDDGRKLYGELSNLADQHMETTEAAYSNAIAEGNVSGANQVARQTATESRTAFLQLAQQHGLNETQANDLANKLGILDGTQISDKIFDTINQDAEAQRKLREAQAAEIANKSFTVSANDNATYTINNIQAALNAMQSYKQIVVETIVRGSAVAVENGGVFDQPMADGGVPVIGGRGRSQVRSGFGDGVRWAEQQVGREYYLSMKDGQEGRNRILATAAVAELGGQAMWGRAGDVRAGTFNAPASIPGSAGGGTAGPVQVDITLNGGDEVAAMFARVASVTVNGQMADTISTLRTETAVRR